MKRYLARINKIDEVELQTLKRRIDIATAVAIFFIAILIVRLWHLQIQRGDDYSQLSESNRVRALDIVAPRGNILDRDGRMIVTNRPCFNIVWAKEDAPNPEVVLKRLARILDEDISTLLERIRDYADRPRHMPFRIKEDIDWQTLVYIENHHFDLPGIRIEVLPNRNYLYGNLASHLIGYLGEINQRELDGLADDSNYSPGDQIGKMGVEKLFENTLHGEKGFKYLEVNVHGLEQKQIRVQEPLPGADLQLTLDIDLQQAAEEAMADKAGAVVAMEANTGRLLAMVSAPTLHLEKFIGGIKSKDWQEMLDNLLHPLINKPVQGQYPPGSTYKIVTALAGLSEGVITPDTVYYCSGSHFFGNRTYGCWKRTGHGAVNLHKALAQSCDVYFYQVGQKLGVDTLARYAASFGLGSKSGAELEHEKPGLVPTSAWKKERWKEPWQEGETLSVAIGQGFNLTTPLQVCRMMAATVNGGILYRPQLVETIRDADGKVVKRFQPIVEGHVLGKSADLRRIRDGLVAVVNEPHGTGGAARLNEILVGGKTGTAQVVHLAQHRGVSEQVIPYKYRDHAWFTCFAPAEAPEIAIAVLVEHGGHGGSVAAPIARKVLERYFTKKRGIIFPPDPGVAPPPPAGTAAPPAGGGAAPATSPTAEANHAPL
ncbi:MAG: penicillin-binding protein 2 [Desulfobulbaceae bacterium]|nr:penicillin-binding protein 2 [Desulfobulbaceae bacterium]